MAPRALVVRQAERIPVECVVRGYVAGSAWAEYMATSRIGGELQPAGIEMNAMLSEPLFTPARKNDMGHDENISFSTMRNDVGGELAEQLRDHSLAIYRRAADYARGHGIILADTKFEFGWIQGELALIDEVLTPDSSRFWDAESWQPGREASSFDKQYVRDWLIKSGWNREPPGPALPTDVITGTVERYEEAFTRLTGESLANWLDAQSAGSIA